MIVMEQINDFLVTHFAREFIDVVAAVDEFAHLALHVAQARARGDHAFQTFAGRAGRIARTAHLKFAEKSALNPKKPAQI
jgi:hypothetical protein